MKSQFLLDRALCCKIVSHTTKALVWKLLIYDSPAEMKNWAAPSVIRDLLFTITRDTIITALDVAGQSKYELRSLCLLYTSDAADE